MIGVYDAANDRINYLANNVWNANRINYDNSYSHLAPDNVQMAIDALSSSANISFTPQSGSQISATTVQGAIRQLEVNFQAGVDAIFNACAAKGSTPASHSLSDVVTAINNITTGIIPTGTFTFPANSTGDSENVYNYAYANAANVYANGYNTGHSEGVASVNVACVTGPNNLSIDTDYENTIDVHVYNRTTNTLKVILNGDLHGDNKSITLTGQPSPIIWTLNVVYDFPPNGDLHIYQERSETMGDDGFIFIGVVGVYSNYSNQIAYDDPSDRYSGYAEFT